MNTLANKPQAIKITFSEDSFSVEFADGRILTVPLAYFPRILNAKEKQREQYVISGGGRAIHWEEIDEDISIENLLMGFGDTTKFGNPNFKAA